MCVDGGQPLYFFSVRERVAEKFHSFSIAEMDRNWPSTTNSSSKLSVLISATSVRKVSWRCRSEC